MLIFYFTQAKRAWNNDTFGIDPWNIGNCFTNFECRTLIVSSCPFDFERIFIYFKLATRIVKIYYKLSTRISKVCGTASNRIVASLSTIDPLFESQTESLSRTNFYI